ncbi:hypothetical protein [Clostridium thermobutyricum]|uniref:hypothetical protein n=1 Tax=Clostridium thermobutyricum TaxID=29372 RepID=UPI0018AAD649|nr:hypothetical protein [Clostridium thermobutyricum]
MKFEKRITLFLDEEEYKNECLKKWLKENFNNIKEDIDSSERLVSIRLDGNDLALDILLELEDILNSPITVCTRYLGSSNTIKSIGLSSYSKN